MRPNSGSWWYAAWWWRHDRDVGAPLTCHYKMRLVLLEAAGKAGQADPAKRRPPTGPGWATSL